MTRVSATIPTRIDLAGGTLDLWPLHHLLEHKTTVNVAVELHAHVEASVAADSTIRLSSQDQNKAVQGDYQSICRNPELPLLGLLVEAIWTPQLPGLTLTTSAKSPAGAGLGGSSCLGIAIAAALWELRRSLESFELWHETQLVQTVQDVEARLIHAPTGCQDYWGGLRGGVNLISFPFGGTAVKTISPANVPRLRDDLLLVYSGKSRASAINNWEIFKRAFDGDRELIERFNRIGYAAEQCALSLQQGDYEGAMRTSAQEWELRESLWPGIHSPETKRIADAAINQGAYLARVCGAGGGGVLAIMAPREQKAQVQEAVIAQGGLVLQGGPAQEGLQVNRFD